MYVYAERGELPIYHEGSMLRSPADPSIAARFAREYSDAELETLYDAACEEFHGRRRRARWRYVPLDLFCSLLACLGTMALTLFLASKAGVPSLIALAAMIGGAVFSTRAVHGIFVGLEEGASREALVRAHSLRMAIGMRKLDRWWKAYDAAGRPPIDI